MNTIESPERYNPTIDDILRLNWHQQKVGKRFQLQKRLQVVRDFMSRAETRFERDEERVSTLPVNRDTADERADYLMLTLMYDAAGKARLILERELQRRGESI